MSAELVSASQAVPHTPAATMQAAVLYGREDLRLERLAIPIPAAGELVVRVEAALTCGTDLKVFRRGYHARMLTPPIPFGHELAGTVVAVGEGVERFAVGDRVAPMNSAPCDACFFCRRGQQNLCDDLLFNNGAYAEYLRVPARIVSKNTLALPPGMRAEHAALTEPLACVVRGLEESAAQPGDTLLVLGAGPIGLLFVHAAALSGMDVVAVVKRDDQVEAARALGAARVFQLDPALDAAATDAAILALTPGGRGADVVIEAVATPATWEQSVRLVRKGGVVNFFGGPPSGTVVALDTNRLHYSDITLKASFHHTPATCRAAFDLLAGGRFQCARFLTGEAGLGEVPAVFRAMLTRSADAPARAHIKTVIRPGGAQ